MVGSMLFSRVAAVQRGRLAGFCASVTRTMQRFGQAPAMRLDGLEDLVPEVPFWRSSGLWHPGLTTSEMLRELAQSKKKREDLPPLGFEFLQKLDGGELTSTDVQILCSVAVGEMLQWRTGPAGTLSVDGTKTLNFPDAEDTSALLDTCMNDVGREWKALELHHGDPDQLLKAFILTGEFLATFLSIHPFSDGNGRSSRRMAGWLLWRQLGFLVALPEPDRATRYTMSPMKVPRYVMLKALQQQLDSSSFIAFLVDCAWNQIGEIGD